MTPPQWQWNEMRQVGTDYADLAEVEKYDRRMATFRDVEAENRRILELLALPPGATVLEIGCGTGRFACAAATAGHHVTAVDISAQMLEYVAEKARHQGLRILDLQHAGFLTMRVPAGHFDAVVSVACLHHLPDAWKLVALENIARCLKPAGQLYLGDVVFSIASGRVETCFQAFINDLPNEVRSNAVGHVAREFSTLDWIMAGLLERAGFEILSAEPAEASFIAYHGRKVQGP